jgi:hypothetical protein
MASGELRMNAADNAKVQTEPSQTFTLNYKKGPQSLAAL